MEPGSDKDLHTIKAVTEAAGLAATRGEWNRVEHYLQLRERLLSQEALSPEHRTYVLTVDRTIAQQITVAQAGLASLLDEAAKTRQRLQGLRRWNGAFSTDSGTIERHI
ncbi:MAG: hypothetical protein ABL965_06515 [Nitrospira sp.]|jgi:hypothetical protein|nr:MAG: hypothetical protein E8D44_12720 [Nitrospira sp.]